MKNVDRWQPTKYVFKRNRLIATRDVEEVSIESRLLADLIAATYDGALKRHAKGKLLDLGCGKVPLYEAYKSYILENTCVDWGSSLHQNEFVDFEVDMTQPLPFGNDCFDTIILSDVLEHIPNPENLICEMCRVLKSDGVVLVNVPFLYRIHEQPHDYYRYTEYALKKLCADAGLDVVELKRLGGTPEVLFDLVSRHLKYLPLIGSGLINFFRVFLDLFLKSKIGKMVSNETSKVFPYAYFLVAEKRAMD